MSVPPFHSVESWQGGAKSFIYKGNDGRWRDTLSEEKSKNYKAMADEKLGTACAIG